MASFKKLKSGWQFRISYKDSDGKYRTKSRNGFRTKSEAQHEAEKMERFLKTGNKFDEEITYYDYMKNWYLIYKKDKHSVKNNRDIEYSLRVVKKYFKQTRLVDITRQDYQKFLNWFGENRATATVKKIHTYARLALLDAYHEKIINTDPTYNAIVKGKNPPINSMDKVLSLEETKKLIEQLYSGLKPSYISRYMILLSLFTGLRFSEVLGLKWEDIDFQNQMLSVKRSFDSYYTNEYIPTKNESSVRKISLDNQTVELLKDYKEHNYINYSEAIFIDNRGECISNAGVNKALKKACYRANIKPINFHYLRHTHCSLLLYAGADILYISKRLGHSDTSITYNTYSHLIKELESKQDEKAIQFLNHL